ncbi:polyprenol phosphomannose-dependent alpha 1,6 mannosyltransferase MptB [Arsenicicoccus sp. oral taxon 190]|uniref:polyprenol phosphomannose-dependent alpha 1,6 mannosyltransferase MptB n=1 Tax=Arsenicicoccus sp. oral taxon 190 TaxID=1658671 RepID=UPI00067DE1B5|nr:polyprenol phosphomannose-dependent alpha 1,6 mannosyltransferase MptB [Arsenicicoccus sp. oral taxon 190]
MILRGVLGALLVLAGGFVTTPLPRSVVADLVEPLAAVGATMPGRMLGLAVQVVGLGLLAWAWLSLVRTSTRWSRGRMPSASLALARRATWAWAIPLTVAPPLFSRDGFSYVAQGELTRRLLTPYDYAPVTLAGAWSERVDPRWMDTITPYGPVPLVWGAVATTLTRDPAVAIVLERLASLLGLALLVWALPELARWCRLDAGRVTALVTASPLMVAHGVGGLHNDVLLAGFAAAGLALAGRGSWGWGAVLGGLAAAVKVPGGLVCVGVVLVSLGAAVSLQDRLRRVAAVAGKSLATLVLCGLPYHLGIGWVSALAVPGEVLTPFSVSTTAGRAVGWVVNHVGLPELWASALTTARTLGMALAVLVAGVLALGGRTGDRPAALRAVAVIMLATLLLGPVVHAWYALWVVPFVAALPLGVRATRVLLAVSVVAGISAPLDSSLEGMVPAIVLTTAMVLAVAVPLLLHTREVSSPATPLEPASPAAAAADVEPPAPVVERRQIGVMTRG